MPHALVLPGWGTSADRLRPMCADLVQRGIDAQPWTYEPTGSIRRIGARLARAAGALGGEVHLVGHSLGGLASASAVLEHGAAVASVTTINAPWRGTWAAWTADRGSALGRDLRWGSDTLAGLRGLLAEHLDTDIGPSWTVLSAVGDMAVPITGSLRVARGPRLQASLVRATGHSVSLLHDSMIAAVAEHVTGVNA